MLHDGSQENTCSIPCASIGVSLHYSAKTGFGANLVSYKTVIIIFIYCSWVVTRWQWLFYMYTKHEIGYY